MSGRLRVVGDIQIDNQIVDVYEDSYTRRLFIKDDRGEFLEIDETGRLIDDVYEDEPIRSGRRAGGSRVLSTRGNDSRRNNRSIDVGAGRKPPTRRERVDPYEEEVDDRISRRGSSRNKTITNNNNSKTKLSLKCENSFVPLIDENTQVLEIFKNQNSFKIISKQKGE